jgi:1-deoxy-D-xylulose-5-phosphate synthase
LKRAVKAVFYTDNFFVDLGFEYVGPIGGHNIQLLIEVLQDVMQRQDAQQINGPVVIHVITRKGKGYGFAEDDPDSYHGVGTFSVNDGLAGGFPDRGKTFTEAFASALYAAAARDKKVAAVTAAMQRGTGLSAFRQAFPDRFYDVGIAEEHAVTFACGLAAGGLKPVVAVYATFIQRAVDQVIHDAALQKLPVILALDRAGFVPDDGETHQGLFDVALFRGAPNTAILSPAGENELRLMLDWALESETGPVIIRYPKTYCPKEIPAFSLPVETGRGTWLSRNNGRVCLVFAGSLYKQVLDAATMLEERGIDADLYNLRFLKPIDEQYLTDLMNSYEYVGFIEEGIREGGFGEYAAALALKRNCKADIAVLAVESAFCGNGQALGTREELLAENGLDGKGIAFSIASLIFEPEIVYDKH